MASRATVATVAIFDVPAFRPERKNLLVGEPPQAKLFKFGLDFQNKVWYVLCCETHAPFVAKQNYDKGEDENPRLYLSIIFTELSFTAIHLFYMTNP